MDSKMLKEDIRTGQVESLAITQNLDGTTFVSAYMRITQNRFTLSRSFPSAVSALRFVEKMIHLQPLAGLFPEYQRPPAILINIVRRSRNEKSQHEPSTKQEVIPERQSSTPRNNRNTPNPMRGGYRI